MGRRGCLADRASGSVHPLLCPFLGDVCSVSPKHGRSPKSRVVSGNPRTEQSGLQTIPGTKTGKRGAAWTDPSFVKELTVGAGLGKGLQPSPHPLPGVPPCPPACGHLCWLL